MIITSNTIGLSDGGVPGGLYSLASTKRSSVGLPFARRNLFAHLFTNKTTIVDGTRYLVNEGSDGVDAIMHTGHGAYFNGTDNNLEMKSPAGQSITQGTLLVHADCNGQYYTDHNILGNDWNYRIEYLPQDGSVGIRIGYQTNTVRFYVLPKNATNANIAVTVTDDGYVTVHSEYASETKFMDAACAFHYTWYMASRKVDADFSPITGHNATLIPDKVFTREEFLSHYNNPEQTLYWDNGVLKSSILDQATIDSMQAGNGFWCPMTENISAGGYYRNHALAMPTNTLPSETPDVIQAVWTDNLDGSFTCSVGTGRDLQWLGDASLDLPYIVEVEIFNYSAGSLYAWGGGAVAVGSANGFYRVLISGNVSGRYLTLYSLNGNFVGSIRNIKVYPLANSGLAPLVNWTSTTSTNASQLTTGYQCALQELDSFGLPIGKPDGLLHGDGRGYIDLQGQVISGDFELDVYADTQGKLADSYDRFFMLSVYDGNNAYVGSISLYMYKGANTLAGELNKSYISFGSILTEAVITIKRLGDTYSIYANGQLYDYINIPASYVKTMTLFSLSSSYGFVEGRLGSYQITKGTRTYEKFQADVTKLMTKYGVIV